MPALTSSDHLAPKSMLRHRPIDPDSKGTELPRVPRASRTHTHKPSAGRTVPIDVPVWKTSRTSPVPWRQNLLMIGMGVGMVLAVLLVFLGQFLVGWIGITLDDLRYGNPRTYQIDAVVGQNDSALHPSHFLALNLRGQIEVIEFPAGDASHAKIYLGPHLYGQHADLVPVTLQFVDAAHDNHPDMIVQVQGEQMVFRNTQGSFHVPPANT